jgi:hypothetical protein
MWPALIIFIALALLASFWSLGGVILVTVLTVLLATLLHSKKSKLPSLPDLFKSKKKGSSLPIRGRSTENQPAGKPSRQELQRRKEQEGELEKLADQLKGL